MEDRRQPWMKFYPTDWRNDPLLRNCCLAARGLWMELLAIMHQAELYGHLLIGGRNPSIMQLATQVGAAQGEVVRLMNELRENGVCSVTDAGVIYSRRMVRDRRETIRLKLQGAKGGNPALKPLERSEDKPPLKSKTKPEDIKPDITQMLDARPSPSEPNGSSGEGAGADAPPPASPPAPLPRKSAKANKTRLPEGFTVPSDWLAWAIEDEGKPAAWVYGEAAKFTDHWRGNGEPKADWDAVWRNWIRRAENFNGTAGKPSKFSNMLAGFAGAFDVAEGQPAGAVHALPANGHAAAGVAGGDGAVPGEPGALATADLDADVPDGARELQVPAEHR